MERKKIDNLEIFDPYELIEEKEKVSENIGKVLGYTILNYREEKEFITESSKLGCNNLNSSIL